MTHAASLPTKLQTTCAGRLSASVALLPRLLNFSMLGADTVAIVIDTLRFTTTAAQALAAGARSVTVISDINEAQVAAASLGSDTRLCGERHCRLIPGFHFGNSPAEYTAESVGERPLVFSTTNGTLAVEACSNAGQVWLGALANRSAVCDALTAEVEARTAQQDSVLRVLIVCAGTDGAVAFEDVLTAGAILERLMQSPVATSLANDSALIAVNSWQNLTEPSHSGPDLRRTILSALQSAAGGRNLIESGFAGDLELAADIDSLSCVPKRVASSPSVFKR